jgi:hypothetical protein
MKVRAVLKEWEKGGAMISIRDHRRYGLYERRRVKSLLA